MPPCDPLSECLRQQKLEKYQGLKKELDKMWGVTATVVPVVMGELGAVTPKLGGWNQQISGTTPQISIQKRRVLGIAKILHITLIITLIANVS